MLVIIHGDNIEKSSDNLQIAKGKFRERGYGIYVLSDSKTSFSSAIRETGLFEEKKLVVVDDPKVLSKKDIEIIKNRKYSQNVSILLFNKGNLTAPQIKKYGSAEKIMASSYPKLLWSFLDSFYPGNSKMCLKLFNEVVKTEAPELILYLLVRQLKDVYLVKHSKKKSEVPPWKAVKLAKIAVKFNDKLLKKIISDLARIDVESKTFGKGIKPALDFLIISKLK